jgi:hypothetical protein
MSIAFEELPESRSLTFDPPSLTTQWVCDGVFSSDTVAQLALSGTPAIAAHPLGILYRQDIAIKEIGHKLYNLTVPYNARKRESGSYRFEFDTLGGTMHVKAGQFIAVFPAGAEHDDGLIGVKGDDVEGCDITIPVMKVTVHFTHPAGVTVPIRIRNLSRLAGTVDTGGFFDWAPYETLFLGAQGSEGSDVETTIAYHFAMSENITNATIGGITGVDKAGWDVASVTWQPTVAGGKPVQRAEKVQIVRPYLKLRNLAAVLGFGAP